MQPKQPKLDGLPAPDVDSARHSDDVARFIRMQIESAGGDISFAEFMQHALYAPGLGYYSAGATKFGAGGDFVTAPEVSDLFGQVLSGQAAFVLRQLRNGSILELGAGSGVLALTILKHLEALDQLPDHYFILEVSADLKERQESLLQAEIPELAGRVVWLEQLPTDFCGVIIANEVADALPVERFMKTDGMPMQSRVACDADGFSWVQAAAPETLRKAINAIEQELTQPLADGYESEISLGLGEWIGDLGRCMQQGFVFIFDYGVTRREYYAESRSRGWLRCHFRHRVHDNPLILAGIQDLTAWVDFTAVAEAGAKAGLDVAGFVSQAHFLLGGGLDKLLEGMASLPFEAQVTLSNEVKLLTLPTEMGENFKCMGLRLGNVTVPPAFSLSDKRHRL